MAGRKGTVAVKFTGDVADLKRATAEAENELGGFGSRVGPKLTTAMAGAGAAVGGALVTGMMEKLDREKTQGRIVASMGFTDEEAARLGKTAGDIYADGFGESFEQVNQATASAMQQLEDFADPEQLEGITQKALNLAYIFETDVERVIATTGYLLRNGLARDADEAFDAITVGLQRIPREMREEAMDALDEYAQSFGALGFDAQEAMELIVAAGQNTSVGIDKVGDAIKEFLIRSTDGSTATVEALEKIGLPAGQIASDIAAGGASAEEAFDKIIEGLLLIEDPAARAQTAIALFGTPIEDLSIDKIPEFLAALQNVEGGFGDIEGASDEAASQLEGDAQRYERAMRKLEEIQQDFVFHFVNGLEITGRAFSDWAADIINKADDVAGALGRIPIVGPLAEEVTGGVVGGILDLDPLGLDDQETIDELEDYLNSISGNSSQRERTSGVGGRPGPPVRHTGGPVHPRRAYIIGRPGHEELFEPGEPGIVHSGAATDRMRSTTGAATGDLSGAILAALHSIERKLGLTDVVLDGQRVGGVMRSEDEFHALRNGG